jgi:CO/xanthine dehydrogenase FAD-binding subunit
VVSSPAKRQVQAEAPKSKFLSVQTQAKPDELLTGIRFPKLPADARSAFIKLGRRNALSISRMSVAAVLQVGGDGRAAQACIVPGAAFPTWKRVPEAEQMLVGEKPSQNLFAAAGQKVSEEMIKATGRRWSTEYKEPVIAVLVRRALEECAKVGRAVPSAPGQSAHTGTGKAPPPASGALGTARPTPQKRSSLRRSMGASTL